MSYEKKVIKWLSKLGLGKSYPNQWFQYHDRALGQNFCQSDFFWELGSCVVLVEVKLTGGPHGKMQMEGLYKPILEMLYGKPVVCLLVCKWVGQDTPGPFVKSPEEFLASGLDFATMQWLGE